MGAELEEVRNMRILVVTFDLKLKFESHLREVVSKAARNISVVPRAGKLFLTVHVCSKAVSMHKFCSN